MVFFILLSTNDGNKISSISRFGELILRLPWGYFNKYMRTIIEFDHHLSYDHTFEECLISYYDDSRLGPKSGMQYMILSGGDEPVYNGGNIEENINTLYNYVRYAGVLSNRMIYYAGLFGLNIDIVGSDINRVWYRKMMYCLGKVFGGHLDYNSRDVIVLHLIYCCLLNDEIDFMRRCNFKTSALKYVGRSGIIEHMFTFAGKVYKDLFRLFVYSVIVDLYNGGALKACNGSRVKGLPGINVDNVREDLSKIHIIDLNQPSRKLRDFMYKNFNVYVSKNGFIRMINTDIFLMHIRTWIPVDVEQAIEITRGYHILVSWDGLRGKNKEDCIMFIRLVLSVLAEIMSGRDYSYYAEMTFAECFGDS
jgi:hypothetical protein